MGEELGRWAEPGLLVLTSLAEGAKHGYAITMDVAEQAGVTLGPGTLYAALQRLEQRGLIEGLPAEGRRRPYRLTAAGAAELSAQAERMRRLATLSLDRLQVRPT
ncbi:PadR family transcriptional regulator [Micromonospora mirobrigensis]|uniref:Transcriptional regulator, PadR family n=1 Tax=Micromonospora mirobrigensis TaxID=262898 RepID=A0A1C4W6K0_9ACTN|nr:PadR family transcriptional regulator [Micromonospora mirobrigensis]SCE91804.1 transcriptional regulator, PadR family [Micromonospora mirobrigensis]